MSDSVNGSNGVASSSADSTETVKKVMKTLVEAERHDRIFEKVKFSSDQYFFTWATSYFCHCHHC